MATDELAVSSSSQVGRLTRFVDSGRFKLFVTVLIAINAIILGVLTYEDSLPPVLVSVLRAVDVTITVVFAIEICLKLLGYQQSFFRNGWNVFDFLVVGISLIPAQSGFNVLRALRVLRVLRLLHVVPMLRRITEALLKALPGMGAIMMVLALLTYVAAVMATNMFGGSSNPDVQALFGDLPKSAFTLFQVMTMDGWRNEVVQVVIDDGFEYAWIFFLAFIFLASFAVLNLFIALIVEALQAEQEAIQDESLEKLEEEATEASAKQDEMHVLLTEMRDEMTKLRSEFQQNRAD